MKFAFGLIIGLFAGTLFALIIFALTKSSKEADELLSFHKDDYE